VFRLYYPVPSY